MSQEQSSAVRLDPRKVLRVLRRRIALVLLCVITVPAAALVVSLVKAKEYRATATLLFRDPQLDEKLFGTSLSTPGGDDAREAATNLKLVSLDVVSQRTSRALGSRLSAGEVSQHVRVDGDSESNVVSIEATHTDPRLAARLANAFASQYIAFRREADRAKIADARQLVARQLAQLSQEDRGGATGRSLSQRLQELEILTSLQTGNAELVETASAPTSAASPQPRRNVAIGIALGLLLGVALALIFERLDRRVRDPEEVREMFDRPVLAVIPASKRLAETHRPLPSEAAESFRMLRANLLYFNVSETVRSVLVTSAQPGDGKSTVAWNLAWASATAGQRTLLIEADLRRPSLLDWTSGDASPGLSGLLSRQSSVEAVTRTLSTGQAEGVHPEASVSVDVIFAGPLPPNPDELLESERMREVLRSAEQRYDLVVLDTPPASVVSDVVPLVREVSGVIVVARLGRTMRDAAVRLAQQLSNLDARVLGVVVNGFSQRENGYGYGYAYSEPRNVGNQGNGRAVYQPASDTREVGSRE